MKIDMNNSYHIFRKNVHNDGDAEARKNGGVGGDVRTDVIDFAKGSTEISDKSLLTLKSGLQRSIGEPTPAERLDAIQKEIKNGTYYVSTNAIVDSILEE